MGEADWEAGRARVVNVRRRWAGPGCERWYDGEADRDGGGRRVGERGAEEGRDGHEGLERGAAGVRVEEEARGVGAEAEAVSAGVKTETETREGHAQVW